MDTDQVDELGRTLMRSATDILDLEESLKYAALRLQSAWLGDRADQTKRQLNSVSSQLSSLANRMDDLAKLTIHESQQWLEVDGSNQSLGSAWWQNAKNNVGDLIEDLPKFGGAAYIISTLHSVPARPNSVALHGS
jgi:CII-binding regulator of phage lambda lysogenization HflD